MARVGGSRVFFDVIGQLQAARLISDTRDMTIVMQGIMLDAFEGINASLTEIFGQIQNGIQSILDPALELGESQIFFEKFFAFDDAELYAESIKEVGLAFGFTGAEALDAGARMAQLGGLFGSPEAVTAGTQAGIAFGLIGGMETEDAMKRLIALAQQTGFLYEGVGKEAFFAADAETQRQYVMMNSLRVMDQLNSVENASVATMEQLSTVMDQFAASATIANMSIAEQAALSATLVEAGESASKAGRSLRMMLARIGSDTGGAATTLNEFGVATQDVNGDMIGLMRIMQQLKDRGWDDLSSTEQAAIAQSVAGRDHYTRFLKLMENFDRTTQLTAIATERQSTAVSELTHFTDNATFSQNQLTAAMESTSAEIGQTLLPSITASQTPLYNMQKGFQDLITVNEDLTGAKSFFDRVGAGATKGIAGAAMMASGVYQIVSGFFEAYLNVQSLIISVRVYQAIVRQTEQIKRMMQQTELGSISNMKTQVALGGMEVDAAKKKVTIQNMGKMVENESNRLATTKISLLTTQQMEQAALNALMREATKGANDEVTAYMNKLRAKAIDKTMSAEQAQLEVTRAQNAIRGLVNEETKIRQKIMLTDAANELEMAALMEQQTANQAAIAVEEERLRNAREVINIKAQMETQDSRMLGAQMQHTNAQKQQTLAIRETIIANIQMLFQTGELTKKERDLAIAALQAGKGIASMAPAATLTVGSLVRLQPAALRAAFNMNTLSGAASLASMALMFFPENEDAMQASMILMAVSMAPAITSMFAMKGAADAATASTLTFKAVAGGFVAIAATAVALGIARKYLKNHREELDETTDSTIDYFTETSYGLDQIGSSMTEPTELMLDFGKVTEDSMNQAADSVRDFMSAREELFFGFSPSRMSQTLFEQLVNQGVGELYYRNEVTLNNNFFGLTVDEMVSKVTDQVLANIQAVNG